MLTAERVTASSRNPETGTSGVLSEMARTRLHDRVLTAMQELPVPWRWRGATDDIQLRTAHSGGLFVMRFRRLGMQGAQPMFPGDDVPYMVPAKDLLIIPQSHNPWLVGGLNNSQARHIAGADPSLMTSLIGVALAAEAHLAVNNLATFQDLWSCLQHLSTVLEADARVGAP